MPPVALALSACAPRELLFPGDGKEAVALLLCGRRDIPYDHCPGSDSDAGDVAARLYRRHPLQDEDLIHCDIKCHHPRRFGGRAWHCLQANPEWPASARSSGSFQNKD